MPPEFTLAGLAVPQIGELQAPVGGEAGADIGDTDLDISLRVRGWWLECVNSPFWQNYTRESEEDEGYYAGGDDQWSHEGDTTDRDRLKKEGRAVVSFNHCQAPVDALTGYERQNRTDAKAVPQGDEDLESARLMTWLLKFTQDSCGANDVLSDVFEDGTITGLRACEVGIDWLKGTRGGKRRAGQCYLENLKCGLAADAELVWDPRWKEYDGSDARYFLRWRWLNIEDSIAQYPEKAEEIRSALGRLDQRIALASAEKTTVRLDDYPEVPGTQLTPTQIEEYFYHPADRRVLLCEAWYHVYDREYAAVERRTGRLIPFGERHGEALEFVASDPSRLRLERLTIRRVRMSVVLPVTATTLDADQTPYPNDDEDYPFAIYMVKRKRQRIYGLIRNMKDPQRVENKRISQLLDMIDRFVRLRVLVQEDSLVTPRTLDDPLDDSPILYKRDREKPSFFVPPIAALGPILIGLADKMKVLLREITGINTEYMVGLRAPDASGRAIEQRVAQGQLVATVVFDHFNRTKRYAHARLARRTQQLYTTEEIVRLTGDLGQSVLVRLNPADAPEAGADRDEYLRQYKEYRERRQGERGEVALSLASLRYDIALAEGPSTPTARAANLRMLLDIVQAVPALAQFFLPTIVKLLDIPDRDQILKEVEAVRQGAMGGGRAGGPAGPAGPATPTHAATAMPPAPASQAAALAGQPSPA